MATSRGLSLARPVVRPERLGLILAVLLAAIIAAPLFPLNLAVVPALVAAVAILLTPWLGLALLTLSVPAQEVGAIHAGGAGLTLTRLALAACVAALVLQLLTRRERLRLTGLAFPFALYIAAILISLRGAVDVIAGIDVAYQWCVALFALILSLYVIRSRRIVLLVMAAIALGAAGESLLGITQSLGNLGPASFAIGNGVSRAFGTFGKPNSYAGYLEMTGPLLIPVALWSLAQTWRAFLRYRRERSRGMEVNRNLLRRLLLQLGLTVWLAVAAVLALVGIQMSYSRGAWMGTAAALLAMVVVSGRRASIAAGAVLMILVLFVAAGGMDSAPATIRVRYEQLTSQLTLFDSRYVMVTPDNFAVVERMAHWQAGLGMFDKYPITGVGAGNFNVRYTEFAVHPAFLISRGHAHNYYIHAAAETGIIGLTTYMSLILSALLICFRAARRAPTGLGRALGIGAVGVTVAVMVHNIVEDLHVLNLGIQLSLVWALAIIGTRFLQPEEPEAEPVKAASV